MMSMPKRQPSGLLMQALFCWAILAPVFVFAQSVDSPVSEMVPVTAKDCEGTYKTGLDLMVEGHYDSALANADLLLTFGKLHHDSLQVVRAWAIQGSTLRRMGLIDSAMTVYKRILPVAKRHECDKVRKNVLNSIGLLYTYQAQYDEALKCHFESLELRNQTGDKFEISISLNNVGFVYYKLTNPDKALFFFHKALELKKQIQNSFGLDQFLMNIGLAYSAKRDYVLARKYITDAFKNCNDSCSDEFLMGGYFGLGSVAIAENKTKEAEHMFLRSYELSKKVNNARFLFDNTIYLADIYMGRDERSRAESYLKHAEKFIGKDAEYNSELAEIYATFSTLYHKSGDYKRIVYYQDKLIALRENIFNEEVTSNLMKVESDFLEREHNARLEAQNKIMVLNEEIISRQRIVNIFIGVVAALVIIVAILLARSNRQRLLLNQQLDIKVKERTKALELNQRELQRAWRERDVVISKASADIQSSMATIKGLCFLGLKDIDHPKAPDYLHKMSNTSDQLFNILNAMTCSIRKDEGIVRDAN